MFDKPHESAELKEVKGLEFWSWEQDGIRKLELTGKGSYSDPEVEKQFKGKFVTEEDLALIIREDTDVYGPKGILDMFSTEDNWEERLIVSFRKGAIPNETSRTAYENLKNGWEATDNRGTASGPVDFKKLPQFMFKYGDPVFKGNARNRAFQLLEDGSISKISRANFVRSGQCGFFGPGLRFPFARSAGHSKSHPEKVEKATPYFERVSEVFKTLAPKVWQRQYDFLKKHNLVENGWTLGSSVYTTITINKNFQTACHQDAGDYSGGLGNITVLENPDKPFAGGYVCFPQWKCGVDLREGDILVFAIHQYHGNTKILPPEGVPEFDEEGEETFERMSLVCYARENMKNAGTKEEEESKYNAWRGKFVPSSKLSVINKQQKNVDNLKAQEAFEEMMTMLEDNGED